MVMTVPLADVDSRLLIAGVSANTWSVGKPLYDIEYTDEFGVTAAAVKEYLHMSNRNQPSMDYSSTLSKLSI